MRAEFCIFESNAPGLKANFYEPYVDMPISSSIIGKLSQFKDRNKCKTHACKEPNKKDHQAAEVAFLAKYGKVGLITGKNYLLIIGSAEALPILCVSDFCER